VFVVFFMTVDRIPISWTLLALSILHFTIWSVGVCEEPARDFFLRQTNNVREGGSPVQVTVQLYLHEKLNNETRQLKDSQKRESEVRSSEPEKLPPLTYTPSSAQEQTISVFLPNSDEASSNIQ